MNECYMKSDDFPCFLFPFFMHIVKWILFMGGIKFIVLTCPRSLIANPLLLEIGVL